MCYCTVFALFNFEFEGNFQVQAPGGLYLEGRFKGGFFTLRGWGLIFGGAYTWRGLFSEFYGDATVCPWPPVLFFQISLQPTVRCIVPQMIPRPQRIFKMDRKRSSTASDPQSRPQMIPNLIGMTWTQVSGSSCRFYYYYKKSD